MKKLNLLALCIIMALSAFAFSACGEKYVFVSDTETVIEVSSDYMQIDENTKLIDYMNKLQNDKHFEFAFNDGMLMSINGKEGNATTFWMLYTSDADNANTQWGTYEYDGKTLGSATLGANSLPIKDGCKYVWVLQSF